MLPHGSYLIKFAYHDAEKHAQALATFIAELLRCTNFQPGSALKEPRSEAIARGAKATTATHTATDSVVVVLETWPGAARSAAVITARNMKTSATSSLP
ncbi:hypothetical protein HDU86_001800 [Geranomyces michiganensis]|nr:hypothetical protein HDU86_001800 [Geranomyces michiganensis]